MASQELEILDAAFDALKAHMAGHDCIECNRHFNTMLAALTQWLGAPVKQDGTPIEYLGSKEDRAEISTQPNRLGGAFDGGDKI